MNDRVSAAPPAQFLGPEELAIFERQFYPDGPPGRPPQGRSPSRSPKLIPLPSPGRRRQRTRERPLSASAHLGQSQPLFRPLLRSHDATQHEQRRLSTEDADLGLKKSSGFLTRVRDAIGLGRRERSPAATKPQPGAEKRPSLQTEPTQPRPARHMAKSHSQSHIPQLPASFLPNGTASGAGAVGSDRPTREEIMKSYNQLMATGFFQSHAIQSTRRPPPGTRPPPTQAQDQPPSQVEGEVHLTAPTRPPPPPPQPKVEGGAHLAAPTRSPPPPPLPLSAEPSTPSRTSCSTMPDMPESPCSPRSSRTPRHSFQMQHLAPPPRAHQRSSLESLRHQLRGRKRARPETDDNASADYALSVRAPVRSDATPLSATGGSFGGIFSLTANGMGNSASGFTKRVSKKLRKMPSGGSTLSERLRGDGVLRTIRTTYSDNGHGIDVATEPREKSIRMRSLSPSASVGTTDRPRGERILLIPPRVALVTGAGGANKLRKKNSPKRGPSYYPPNSLDNNQNRSVKMGLAFSFSRSWGSSPSTSADMDLDSQSARSSIESWDVSKGRRSRDDDGVAEPLSVVPDMNRGIPSVPRIPDAYIKTPNVRRAPETCTRNHENFSQSGMEVDWRFGEAL